MKKEDLRAKLKGGRKNLTNEEISRLSYRIEKQLFSMKEIENADMVMVYSASFNEPRTIRIIKRLFDMEKRVALPITDTQNTKITASLILPDDDFKRGAFGIMEPQVIREVDKSELSVVLVPGVGFDANGNRMGFGGGFYDRFLEGFDGFKIGICYDFQVVEKIPVQETDIPMDAVVTESQIYRRKTE